jgi:hypothetical protein
LLHIDLGDDEGVGDFVPVNHGSELKRCEHDGSASDEPDRDALDVHVAIVDFPVLMTSSSCSFENVAPMWTNTAASLNRAASGATS